MLALKLTGQKLPKCVLLCIMCDADPKDVNVLMNARIDLNRQAMCGGNCMI